MTEERREEVVEQARRCTDGHPLQMVGWLSRRIVELEMELEGLRKSILANKVTVIDRREMIEACKEGFKEL